MDDKKRKWSLRGSGTYHLRDYLLTHGWEWSGNKKLGWTRKCTKKEANIKHIVALCYGGVEVFKYSKKKNKWIPYKNKACDEIKKWEEKLESEGLGRLKRLKYN